MERELWTALCALAAGLHNRLTAARYSDEVICAVYWWAVVHDRPTSWACRRENWSAEQARPLPSQPTMSRRLRSAERGADAPGRSAGRGLPLGRWPSSSGQEPLWGIAATARTASAAWSSWPLPPANSSTANGDASSTASPS
jgi:hypothetical protein